MKTKPWSFNAPMLHSPPSLKLRWLFALALCMLVGTTAHVHGGVIYSANFDTGNDGYTYTPDVNAPSNLWHRTSISSASPGFSQYYGLEATTNYNTGAQNAGNLQSPVISLAGAYPPVKLSFNYALETESSPGYDQATVSVSTNGGANWITLATRASSNPLTQGNFHSWAGDLSAFAGSSILLQFNFDTIDGAFNTAQGWFVDDVTIEGTLAAAYVRSTNGLPWGSADNETAMTTVFGTNWSDLRYETLNPAAMFNGSTRFVFMDGSFFNATEMAAFLTNNAVVISNWVSAGGSLFLNSAPNEGGSFDFGFGVTLIHNTFTPGAEAAIPAHPIFNGPFTPVGTSFTGTSFGHAVVSGTNLTSLLTNASVALPILAEKPFRFGHVIFGGMTVPQFHSPSPQSANLLANIIAYGAALGQVPAKPQVAVFDNPLYVDTTSASPGAESDTVQASLTNRGFAVVTFTNIVEAAAANNVLLIPELENGDLAGALTAAERSALSNHVVSGGTMIVHGGLSRASGLINSVLGLSVVETFIGISNNLTAAAIGTQFADDPAIIPYFSATRALQKVSLPPGSRSIYETNGGSSVAEMYFGAGKVIYLGWDWFNAAPLGVNDAGWLQVLESAVLERSLTPFYDDFDNDIDLGQWSAFGGVIGTTMLATNFGGSISGANALWFGNAGSRFAASRSLNTLGGGTVDFWIRLGNAANPWDFVELPAEGVVLEYSNDGGGTWVEMGRYDTATYRNWTHVVEDILPVAQTANTRFRWRQLANSSALADHWALDNVGVFGPRPPLFITQPVNTAVAFNGSPVFNVTAEGTPALFYFWLRNGVPIAGANSPSYTTNNVTFFDSGAQFSCIVSNTFGTATSSNATLSLSSEGLSGALVYYSPSTPFTNALTSLGLPFQAYNGIGSFSNFEAAVAACNPATTLVIVDVASDFAYFTNVVSFVGAGGRAIASYWDLDTHTNAATAFQATLAGSFTTPLPVYDWGSSTLFTGVSVPLSFGNFVGDDGDKLQPIGAAQAVAGFVTSPAVNEGAIIIGVGNRTILNGFMFYEMTSGADALQLAKNEIQQVSGGAFNVISPTLVGNYNAGLGTLELSWSSIGYHLQSQTNSSATGLSNNWVNYPGGATSPVVITPNATNPAVFFRLVSP